MNKKLTTLRNKRKSLQQFGSLLLASVLKPSPAVFCQPRWPKNVVIYAQKHGVWTSVCLAPVTLLAVWEELASPQLSILLAPSPQPWPLNGRHTPGSCLAWVREAEGSSVDTSCFGSCCPVLTSTIRPDWRQCQWAFFDTKMYKKGTLLSPTYKMICAVI